MAAGKKERVLFSFCRGGPGDRAGVVQHLRSSQSRPIQPSGQEQELGLWHAPPFWHCNQHMAEGQRHTGDRAQRDRWGTGLTHTHWGGGVKKTFPTWFEPRANLKKRKGGAESLGASEAPSLDLEGRQERL